jgi:hypothetical protein
MMTTTCWILWIASGGEVADVGAVDAPQATRRRRKTGLARRSVPPGIKCFHVLVSHLGASSVA